MLLKATQKAYLGFKYAKYGVIGLSFAVFTSVKQTFKLHHMSLKEDSIIIFIIIIIIITRLSLT